MRTLNAYARLESELIMQKLASRRTQGHGRVSKVRRCQRRYAIFWARVQQLYTLEPSRQKPPAHHYVDIFPIMGAK
jgi:hypothetical protein